MYSSDLDFDKWTDGLVNACTGFHSFTELLFSMADGYVPTLYTRTRRERLLRRVLKAMCMPVYPE